MSDFKMSLVTHDKLLKLVHEIQKKHTEFSDYYNKLVAIDEACAKSKVSIADPDECQGNNSTLNPTMAIKVPVVNSEVDSIVAFLAGIFVNRTPLFGVISDDKDLEAAIAMQSLISKDARQQRWGRQLLNFLNSSVRYNTGGIEIEATQQKDFEIKSNGVEGNTAQTATYTPVVRLNSLDMYNALFDQRVSFADMATKGEYSGYNSIISKTELISLGSRRSKEKISYNLDKAYKTTMDTSNIAWRVRPDISGPKGTKVEDQGDWLNWLDITDSKTMKMPKASYFLTKLYVRIIPEEFDIKISEPRTPRIIRLEVVNNKWIISYKEMLTPLELLPILFSDTKEDGFDYQTMAISENVMPWQEIATELLHIKLEGSKRALGDRAIYDTDYLDPMNINSPFAAAKIPLKKSLRNAGDKVDIRSVYHQIPFESQGLTSTIADLNVVMSLKDQANGVGMGMRGEHRKGNRTRGEFEKVDAGSEAKGMPYALRLEEQVITPLKMFIKYFVLTSEKVEYQILDVDSKTLVNVNIIDLRKAMLEFKLTDGLRPKEAHIDPGMLTSALQVVQNSEEINQEYSAGGIFAELLATANIDISKHKREVANVGDNTGGAGAELQPGDTRSPDEGSDTGAA